MKLLFDQNLSPRLINLLADLYTNSVHVQSVGLSRALDKGIWDYALQNNYIIVTKDADFSELGLIFGFPPKVIWIRRGNCSTAETEAILCQNYEAIKAMNDNPNIGILTLY